MRTTLVTWLVCGLVALCCAGCADAPRQYVTATPSRPPRATPTPGATPPAITTPSSDTSSMPPMPRGSGSGEAFALSSSAFAPGELLPLEYSCFGENTSPALDWAGTPSNTASLVLTVTDPDAPEADFVHWLVYNIPADSTGLPPALPGVGALDDGALQGTNDFITISTSEFASGAPVHVLGWDGPCPSEEHRYVFRLYALDTLLDLAPGAMLVTVSEAMQGHVLAVAELEARFVPPR